MRRLAFLAAVPLLLIAAGDPPAGGDDAALRAELDALFRAIEGGEIPMLPPGRAPDLMIASSRQVLGELAPCG